MITASVVAHEYGHIYVAKRVGWKYKGLKFKWFGPAIKVDPKDKLDQLWKVSFGGLLVTLFLSLGFYLLSFTSDIFLFIAYFNLFMFFINALPIKPSDGWQIISSLRGKDTRIIDS